LLHFLLLFRRQAPERLVLLTRDLALVRRKRCPRAHLLLDPLLLVRRHPRIPLRDAAPLQLALGIELVPVGRERRENLLLGGRQFGPRRGARANRLGRNARGRSGREHPYEKQIVDQSVESAVLLSQFWNPRSR
jgi:hypothetical protein